MPNDRFDPERAERELGQRKGRGPDSPQADMPAPAESLPAMRQLPERPEAGTASRIRGVAALGAVLARMDAKLSPAVILVHAPVFDVRVPGGSVQKCLPVGRIALPYGVADGPGLRQMRTPARGGPSGKHVEAGVARPRSPPLAAKSAKRLEAVETKV